MLSIRPYEEKDFEPLRTVMNEVVAVGEAFTYDPQFTPEGFRAYLCGYSACYVADNGGQIVGGYAIRPVQPGRGSHVANAAYFLAGELRGHGAGRLLGLHSLSEAKRLGFRAVQYNAVVSTNAPAVALWKKLGFQVIGTVPQAFQHPDGSLVDLLIMYRFLADIA